MSRYPSPYATPTSQAEYVDTSVIASFVNSVYAWMCAGLAVTAVMAWWGNANQIWLSWGQGVMFGIMVVAIVFAFLIFYALESLSATAATVLFLVYAAMNGLWLSFILMVYASSLVYTAFFATAGMFLAMSVIGFTTRKDLSSMGSFLLMALIGLILASILNMFVASSGLDWLVCYAGVAIFLGLTAYDTQKMKAYALATAGNPEATARLAIVASLDLYLDFINLFLYILRILAKAKE